MDRYYREIIKSGEIVPSDPATRSPLVGGGRGIEIRLEPGTPRPCARCKWGAPDPTIPTKGQCVALRNSMGNIWKRFIPDYYNMTCERFEEGEIYFREHV